jgi:hypothetical protein
MEAGMVISGFTAVLFALVAMPFFLHFRGERRKRELDHIERMRAIEVGRAYPGEGKFGLAGIPQWIVPHVIAVSIGAVVPLGVFLCAFLASLITGFHKDIWVAASMVGFGGVICGTVLEGVTFSKTSSTGEPEQAAGAYLNSKPHIDEDAYDVVSSRG